MLANYLKVALRALLADRFFSLINICGLSVGLACVLLVFFYVEREFSYDDWLPDTQSLYRLDTFQKAPGRAPLEIARAPGPVRDALLSDFPQIEDIARAHMVSTSAIRDGQPFNEDILVADPNLFALLRLPMAHGSPHRALADTTSVALSTRMAEKYFGRREAVGERLVLLVPEAKDFEVSAVFETLPENSHMAFDIVVPIEGYFGAGDGAGPPPIPEQWGGAYFHTYVRLRPGTQAADVQRALPDFVDRHLPQWLIDLIKTAPRNFYAFHLVPLRDVHFDGAPLASMKPPGDRTTVLALLGIAALILVIACINFTNLATARSTLRAREIALRKAVGATRRQIAVQFMGEAFVLTAMAGVLAVGLIELAAPYLDRMLGGAIGLPGTGDPALWARLGALIALTAVGAGLYPALVLSGVRPAAVFNPDHGGRAASGMVRSLLVVLQFAISIALMVVTAVVLLQTGYARTADLGFDKDNLLIVRVADGPRRDLIAQTVKDTVSRRGDVVAVGLSSAVPSDPSENNIAVRVPGAANPVQIGYHTIDSDFFRTYGVEPLAGRLISTHRTVEGTQPSATDEAERSTSAVVNEAALRRLGFTTPADALGRVVRTSNVAFTIVGVVSNIHFRSLHRDVREELYHLDDRPGGVVSIKYRSDDASGLLSFVDRTWRDLVPDRAIDRTFLDAALNAQYSRERAQAGLLSGFAGIALVLSCLGLLAMASFSVQRRTREIAVRKVMGARSRDIARLLLWQFSKPVLVANLVAWPVAFAVLSDWLKQFAYRIDLPVSVFFAAGALAMVIAWLAIATHTLKVAGVSPAETLRHD